MKLDTHVPSELAALPTWARWAEEIGFDGFMTSEVTSNPFVRLTLLAEHTERPDLGTGIALAFVRSPITMAYAALDIQRFSEGRLTLGLGTQTRWQIERRFGMAWSAPARRMREYVEVMRAAWDSWADGSAFRYDGEVFQLDVMTPNHRPTLDGTPFPKIHLAAVGPLMSRTAGQYCDGIQIHPFGTVSSVRELVLPRLGEGAKRAGRSLSDLEISGGGMVATGATDHDVERARRRVRSAVSYYGHFPEYQEVWAIEGLEDLGRSLQDLAASDRWDEMPALVDDDVLNRFAAVGRYDEIGQRIVDRFAGYATRVHLPTPAAGVDDDALARAIELLHAAPDPTFDR